MVALFFGMQPTKAYDPKPSKLPITIEAVYLPHTHCGVHAQFLIGHDAVFQYYWNTV